ncbi:T9SS type A sorting domain-containing protein [Winogradskyella sp. F6397]|uniref:T9SS type A sorting domain-containing protein n=1 Tax=Winogradskyella marina TaxID=2785530 RepID=A0ABS0EPI0_9FLAO|nr:T9SS type A sorting domain-containing protein [Winogradskyella marina]MBF8151482.1 T9SS type A sorting domain-containing protein [Winogradskyella marina]
MKQFYIFILAISISIVGFSQNTNIQLELVNPSIGQPSTTDYFATVSNDDDLNAILSSYNVTAYQVLYPEVHSDLFYDDTSSISRFIDVVCQDCDIAQLIIDVTAHSDVVKYATADAESDLIINNALTFNLVDNSIGEAIGVNDMNIIETNDEGLNQIFSDYNVRGYEPVENPYNNFWGNESIICDCDAALLKQELESYSTVISEVYEVSGGMLLSLDDVTELVVSIYPNPFKSKVSVEIKQPLKHIMFYDVLGKQIFKSSSILDLENFSSTLKSGVYLLKLLTTEGKSLTKKLIKS